MMHLLRIMEFYDKLSKVYDQLYSQEQVKKYTVILSICSISRRVLDVGCGTGLFEKYIHENTPTKEALVEICGIDISYGMLSEALRKQIPESTLLIDFINSIGQILPLRENTFDMCFAVTVFDKTLDILHFLEEARRVLKPGGVIILSVHKRANIKVQDLLAQAVSKGFKPLSVIIARNITDIIVVLRNTKGVKHECKETAYEMCLLKVQ